jgi:hypothetical protein
MSFVRLCPPKDDCLITFQTFGGAKSEELQPLLLQTQSWIMNSWFDKLRDPASLEMVKTALPEELKQPSILKTGLCSNMCVSVIS